jgi:acetoin utilization deacetylase AcuC-like enzyme
MTTLLVYDERCLAHHNGSMLLANDAQAWLDVPHVESATRLERTIQVLDRSGVAGRLQRVPARAATEEDLLLAHTPAHVAAIRDACERGVPAWVGPEARVGTASWEPALLAAGGSIEAVDRVLDGRCRNAYVLVRPPGHHASAEQAMGFCLFNNVAIAGRHAQRRAGVERVAIVDWDVHHGNGTQALFYDDPNVLFISLQQDGLYPADSGRTDETGTGPGSGATVNIPLPAGSGDAGYLHAFDEVVVPALRAFAPGLILVSAGQDPSAADPLGRMSVTTEGFRWMASRVRAAADELCDGRLVLLQEGGYSADHLPFCVLAIVEAVAGLSATFERDPMELDVPTALTHAEAAAVRAAREASSAAVA